MPFRVDISVSESDISREGSSTLTATVIDTDTGEETTETVTYLWTQDIDTGSLSSTTTQTVTYSAVGFGVDDVPAIIEITCTATISDITPVASSITLTTLSDLGIDELVVNMLFTVEKDGNDLFDSDNADAVDTDSDVNIEDDLTVHRVTWNPDNYQLQLHKDVDNDVGSMVNYWVFHADANSSGKSIYLVLADGEVIEITQFHSASSDFGTWELDEVDDIDIIESLNDISDGQSILLGIGDRNTLDEVTASVSGAVFVSILGELDTTDAVFDRTFIRPIIDMINSSFINRLSNNTAFNKLTDVSNKPKSAYGIIELTITPYDTEMNEQRYRTYKTQVMLSSRIDGVSELPGDYVVILQRIGDSEYGIEGRRVPIYAVYNKTSTSFYIVYEEGVDTTAFGSDLEGSVNVQIAWFARGY